MSVVAAGKQPPRPSKGVRITPAVPVAPSGPVVVVEQRQHQAGGGERPVGVLLVSLLLFLSTLPFVILGIFAIVAAAVGGAFAQSLPSWIQSIIAVAGAVVAILALGLAALFFWVGMGNLRGRGWAWTVVIVISLLYGLFGVLGLFAGDLEALPFLLVQLGLSGLILWYYYTPSVKRFFGKSNYRAVWQRSG